METIKYPEPPKDKEFLYVGYYFDDQDRFILKIGTTNNLQRRQTEHNRTYRKSPDYTMPKKNSFNYLWYHPLSKYNTLRYEDKNRTKWWDSNKWTYIRNDRFYCKSIPKKVSVKIRKTYEIPIKID